ncbi:MAG: CinA family nicotinamide mononucleotide deamidase-related protein [Phycisphaerales bacterium]
MNAAVISIGDEIACGDRVDTNSAWIARRLSARGVRVTRQLSLPDDRAIIAAALRSTIGAVEVVVATGGLGPTGDDLTRFALADVLGEDLENDEEALATLRARFDRRGMEMAESNRVQALRPPSARFLPNPLGTAQGLDAERGARMFFLPGVPPEMMKMYDEQVAPALETLDPSAGARVVRAATVQAVSIAESRVADLLKDLLDRREPPLVGTLVSDGVLSVRIRHEGSATEVDERVCATSATIRERLGPYVYGADDEPLAVSVLRRLVADQATLVTAESCTGGMLGAMITDSPGASEAYLGGWQTYANAMKTSQLGVPAKLIRSRGAVSAEVAEAMAQGALERGGADFALSITGVAGPEGGSEEKPVGTVYLGLAYRRVDGRDEDGVTVRRFEFSGDRDMIRRRSATSALAMLVFHLDHRGSLPEMLWERSD